MCVPLIPSWSFTSTVSKEMNNLPRLPRIFIGNWAVACYSCCWFCPGADPISWGWIRVAPDSILRPNQVPAAGYDLRLSRVPADGFKLRLSRVPAVGYKLRLNPMADSSSGGLIRVEAVSSYGEWIQVTTDSILRLTLVPPAEYELRPLDTTYSWFILRLTSMWFKLIGLNFYLENFEINI